MSCCNDEIQTTGSGRLEFGDGRGHRLGALPIEHLQITVRVFLTGSLS